jgi:hypothetical protein
MPLIGAIVGAIVTGLFYWLMWGGGMQYIDARMRQSRDRKREAEQRAAAIEKQRMAPLRSIADARDAAAVLMVLVASQRGVPTPEQNAAIEREMREVLGFGAELDGRMAYAKSPPSRRSRRRTPSIRSRRSSGASSPGRSGKSSSQCCGGSPRCMAGRFPYRSG